MCIVQPSQFTICHVNEPWSALCGYSQEDVVGQGLSVLQGPDTDTETVQALEEMVSNGMACEALLVNYTKDNTGVCGVWCGVMVKESMMK